MTTEKASFTVTGMTCSACSAHVEKAVRACEGVTEVSVSLLTNTMLVTFHTGAVTPQQIITAVQKAGYGANLVITHHPYIFHPISDIDFDSPQGELIVKTIKAGVTVYSAHTNLDFTIGGINDAMMETIGITNQKADKSKCHRYGKLKESMTVEEFFKMVKKNFDAPNSRLILPENVSKTKKISKIGVSSGSFDDDFSWIKEYNVEVLVTGEMKHNQAIDFKNRKIIGISLGHFESENVGIEKLSKIVRDRLGIDTLVTKSCNPFSDL